MLQACAAHQQDAQEDESMLASEGIVLRIIAELERLIHDLRAEAPVILYDGYLVVVEHVRLILARDASQSERTKCGHTPDRA